MKKSAKKKKKEKRGRELAPNDFFHSRTSHEEEIDYETVKRFTFFLRNVKN